MKNIQNLSVDIMDNHIYETAYAKQFDSGRELHFTVTENGQTCDLTGIKADFQMKKPDGTIILRPCLIEDGKIIVTLDKNSTACCGNRIPFQLQLTNAERVITTATGHIKIDESVVRMEDIESTNDFTTFSDILLEISAKHNESKACAESAKKSELACAKSEENAGDSEANAGMSENAAKASELAASAAAAAAANSADIATQKAGEASAGADDAQTSANDAANSADTAIQKAVTASNSAADAEERASEASDFADMSRSYSVGTNNTVRENDNIDNAKYYYLQAKSISESFSGALRPMGTVAFAALPALSNASDGDMYNITDKFTTNTDFKEGEGVTIPAGSNIYKTADGKWDVLAGSPVTSVNGEKGDVVITPAKIGALGVNDTATYATYSTNADSLSYFKNTSTVDVGSDVADSNAIGYVINASPIWGSNKDGALYKQVYSADWMHEIFGDYRTGQIATRGKKNGALQPWRKQIDSGNYTDYVGNGTITLTQNGTVKGSFTTNQSGNTTIELPNTNTWRGIQNNLTSTSATDSLSAYQGKILQESKVGSYTSGGFKQITTLLKYADSNNANLQSDGINYILPLTSASDERIKENISHTEVNALKLINSISHHSFDFKFPEFGEHTDIGYVAQELIDIIPEAVISTPQDEEKFGYAELYQVNYTPLIPYLTKAVQELSERLEESERKLQELYKEPDTPESAV